MSIGAAGVKVVSILGEDYSIKAPVGQEQALLDFVQQHPGLKAVFMESGVSWLPNFIWRANKTWRGVRAEVPWLDKSPVRSIRYRPDFHKYIYGAFVVSFLVLGYLGIKPPSPLFEFLAQVGTIIYLAFFLAMPWWSKLGSFKQVPDRVTFHAH